MAINMHVSVFAFYESFHNVLWEDGNHKRNVFRFLLEIDDVIQRNSIEKLDDGLVDQLISYYRKKGNSNATINRKLAALYKILRKAERAGLITRLPSYVRLPEKNARVRFLTREEERFLLPRLEERDKSYKNLCIFLIDTGARVGEALGLKHGDVHNGRATFWITKSGRSRTVPLTDRAVCALADQGRQPGGPFHGVAYQKFLYHWNAVKREMGLKDDPQFVPHMLRHTCASRLVQAGIDLRRVQTFLGHQTIQMTLRYAHLATDDLDQCVIALDRVNAKNERPDSHKHNGKTKPGAAAAGRRRSAGKRHPAPAD
ncbi:tyrosine-type recombinase/integrase [Oceaniradius stylonematis]|uniref:tyrosine-type recombinase/integrase n=1 Tax=Oceaniradius stylonematis TaxID=2184161 RepID=UPI0035CF15D7